MRKFIKNITLIVSTIMALSLVGCTGGTPNNSGGNDSGSQNSGNTNGSEYAVKFVQENQKDVVIKVSAGATLAELPIPKEVEGYTVTWENVDLTNISSDITVNSVKTANSYVVTYNADGGTVSEQTQSVIYDSTYQLATPTKDGYEFISWLYDYMYIDQTGTWKIAGNITINAQWKPYTYKIIYNFGKNTSASMTETVQYVEYNSEFTLATPKNSDLDFVFQGWVITGTNEKFESGTYTTSGDVSLTAIWKSTHSGQY